MHTLLEKLKEGNKINDFMRIQIVELMGNNVNKLNEVKNLLNKISDEDDFNFLKEIEKIHDCN